MILYNKGNIYIDDGSIITNGDNITDKNKDLTQEITELKNALSVKTDENKVLTQEITELKNSQSSHADTPTTTSTQLHLPDENDHWVTYDMVSHDNQDFRIHIQYNTEDRIDAIVDVGADPEHWGYYVRQMVFDFDITDMGVTKTQLEDLREYVNSESRNTSHYLNYKGDAPSNLWEGGRSSRELNIGFRFHDTIFSINKTPNEDKIWVVLKYDGNWWTNKTTTENAAPPDLDGHETIIDNDKVLFCHKPN